MISGLFNCILLKFKFGKRVANLVKEQLNIFDTKDFDCRVSTVDVLPMLVIFDSFSETVGSHEDARTASSFQSVPCPSQPNFDPGITLLLLGWPT